MRRDAPEANVLNEARRKYFSTQQSLNNAVWSVCDIMRRSSCSGALQYIPELTWLLFLRILDERETEEAQCARERGLDFVPSLLSPYRWQDWAAPNGAKRIEMQQSGRGAYLNFINQELIPCLNSLGELPSATPRQKLISEIMSGVERSRLDSERNLTDILDKLHTVKSECIDPTHMFILSQVYEGLLLRLGDKGSGGGQFFTPREVVRAMVRTVAPKIGATVYDPCCGTGGFLAQSFEYMWTDIGAEARIDQENKLKHHTFYGREKDKLIYPIALANLMLHGIDDPHIRHGNTLTGDETFGGLFKQSQPQFDVILTNPPFGGKEGEEAKQHFEHKSGTTQILFLQHVLDSLKPGGRCGIVLDEGVLFRTNETAYLQTKRRLLEECEVWCIVSLPVGAFMAAGAFIKTDLLFFSKGRRTEHIWYYDLSDLKIGKKTPLTLAHFDQFFRLLPNRGLSERSWIVRRDAIEKRNFDLKAVNPSLRMSAETRTQEELLQLIEAKGQEISNLLARLHGTIGS